MLFRSLEKLVYNSNYQEEIFQFFKKFLFYQIIHRRKKLVIIVMKMTPIIQIYPAFIQGFGLTIAH